MPYSSRLTLIALSLQYDNNWDAIYSALSKAEKPEDSFVLVAESTQAITFLDAEYPRRLKQKYKPPFVLYYSGDKSALSLVDENGGKNNLVFLHGDNTFDIPLDRLVTIDSDVKVDICGRLKVWFNRDKTPVCRFGLAAGLAHNLVCTKIYDAKHDGTRSWFNAIAVPNAEALGANVFYVATSGPSFNNNMIKSGCFVIDSLEDLESYYGR